MSPRVILVTMSPECLKFFEFLVLHNIERKVNDLKEMVFIIIF